MPLLRGYIGPYEMISWDGPPHQSMGMNTEEITRPGVDGVAAKQTGRQPAFFTVRTKGAAYSDADLSSLIDGYHSLKGWLVTITPPGVEAAYSRHNVLIKDVQIGRHERLASATGGTAWLLEAVWTLQATEVPV